MIHGQFRNMVKRIKIWLIFRFKLIREVNYLLFYRNDAVNAREECERRRRIDILDINSLGQELNCPYYYRIEENNLYGNGLHVFKHFPELNVATTAIEHGLIFGSLVQSFHIDSWTTTVVTFSDYRKDFIKAKTDKNVVCVGPYIHYANTDNVIDKDQKLRLKKDWGKTLLVFPFHSIKVLDLQYDKDTFLECIEKSSLMFNSVVICVYWADVLKGAHKIFLEKGYKVVTAGHTNDCYFIDRLKTFIELSDAVLSNSVGTHVGYSIYLNKPLVLFKQEVVVKPKDPNNFEFNQRSEYDSFLLEFIKDEIYRLFSFEDFEHITPKQYQFISNLFGFKYVRKILS